MPTTDFLQRLLLPGGSPTVRAGDLAGPHAALLAACRAAGFLAASPSIFAVPTCPHCHIGRPYEVGAGLICARCRGRPGPDCLLGWVVDGGAFRDWLAGQLSLRGGVRRVGPHLWHLGTSGRGEASAECFHADGAVLSPDEANRLERYHTVTLLHVGPAPALTPRPGLRLLPLGRVLLWDGGRLSARSLDAGEEMSRVRFDAATGGLWAGAALLGEVPLGSRAWHLLGVLAESQGRYVGYAELRREVLRRSGGRDSRDEATFCQEVKRRIKKLFAPEIDRVLTTNNKAAGYRLRASVP